MSFFVIFLITLLDCVAVCYLTRRSFGRMAAVVNLSLIVLLYVAGLFTRLDIGMYVFFALSGALVLAALVLLFVRKDWNKLVDVVKNPLFVVYVALGITVGIALLNKLSHDYDEMTHWALVTKNMLRYNNFGNIGDTTTMFNRYVPATGVFMYAFGFLNKTFVNGNCYAAFDVLLISLLLPLPDRYQRKEKFVPFVTTLVGSMVLISILKWNIYFNLRIDALLGVMGAYPYLVYLADRGKANGWTLAEMSLGCFVLTITKTSGVALAGIALGLVVLDVLLRDRDKIKPVLVRKINWVLLLLPVVAIVIAKVSWSVYCDVLDVRAGWNTSELTASSLWAYMTQPNEFQTTVTKLFWKTYFVGTFRYGAGSLQLPALLYIPLLAIGATVIAIKERKSFGIGMGIATLFVMVMYAVINLMLYIFSFSYGESLVLASWPRYYGTIVTMMALIWLSYLIEACLSRKELPAPKVRPAWITASSLLAVFCIVISAVFCGFWQKDTDKALAKFRPWMAALETLKDTDNVYYAVASEEEDDYYLLRFLATPTRCSGLKEGGSYTDGRGGGIYTGDIFSWSLTANDLAQALQGYNYFWLDDQADAFAARYGTLFEGEIKAEVLYTVTHTDGGIVLRIRE